MKKPLKANKELFPEEVWVETGRSITQKPTIRMISKMKESAPEVTTEESTVHPEWLDVNPRKLR